MTSISFVILSNLFTLVKIRAFSRLIKFLFSIQLQSVKRFHYWTQGFWSHSRQFYCQSAKFNCYYNFANMNISWYISSRNLLSNIQLRLPEGLNLRFSTLNSIFIHQILTYIRFLTNQPPQPVNCSSQSLKFLSRLNGFQNHFRFRFC